MRLDEEMAIMRDYLEHSKIWEYLIRKIPVTSFVICVLNYIEKKKEKII